MIIAALNEEIPPVDPDLATVNADIGY